MRALLVLLAWWIPAVAAAQAPCTNANVTTALGRWVQAPDDLAMRDPTFPKAKHPVLFAKGDRAIELVRRLELNPIGFEGRTYHEIRGAPLVAGGPVPFGVDLPLFDLWCTTKDGAPGSKGTVAPEDETNTSVNIDFNSLGQLGNDWMHLPFLASNGNLVLYQPKVVGEIQGGTLYRFELQAGLPLEVLVFTANGKPIYRPFSQERFLKAREKLYQAKIDELMKGRDYTLRGQHKSELEAAKAKLGELLAAMSPEEKKAQAFVKFPEANPLKEQLFVPESQGGRPLVTIEGSHFEAKGPREAIKTIAVFWPELTPGEKASPKRAFIAKVREKLDFKALKQLLEP